MSEPEWERQKNELVGEITGHVEAMMLYSASAEAIASLMPIITLACEQAKRLSESDSDLLPELRAAVDHLAEASRALVRAHEFASARLDVRLGQR